MNKYFSLKKSTSYFVLMLSLLIHTMSFANNTLANQLKTILTKNLADSSTPGAVLLVSSPYIGTITVAAGLAYKAGKIPMKDTNNFRLASMSKTFMAVTLLKLAEQKKIDLHAKIADLLPSTINIKRIANGKQVTVKQLMQMRSGIPNYTDFDEYTELVDNMEDETWTPELCIKIIYDEKPNFVAGKSYEYSNTNYLLLQLILENLSGGSYATPIRQEILTPLHLNNTFIEIQEANEKNMLTTHGYEEDDDEILNDVTNTNDGFGLADGGMISTATDINTFIRALLYDKTLLTPASLQDMLTIQDDYGLGIYREKVNEQWAWTHNGSSGGFDGQYYYFPKEQLSMVLLTNDFNTDIIDDVASQVLKLLKEERTKNKEAMSGRATSTSYMYN